MRTVSAVWDQAGGATARKTISKSFFITSSESESSRELKPPWRLCANGSPEEWRADVTDVIRIVDVIQKIERIDGNRKSRHYFISRTGQFKIAKPAEIVFRISRSL